MKSGSAAELSSEALAHLRPDKAWIDSHVKLYRNVLALKGAQDLFIVMIALLTRDSADAAAAGG